MIYVHSMGRAMQYYPDRPALSLGQSNVTFSQLHDRVKRVAAGLSDAGFRKGDRLAVLLPTSPEYIEMIYACSWLGVIAVPINVRLSTPEIDNVLADSAPRGIVRHSTLPKPNTPVSLDIVLDRDGLTVSNGICPDPCYDPDAILALIYTSGTTGRPKGVMLTHSNVLADVNNFNYWMRYREGGVYLHAAHLSHCRLSRDVCRAHVRRKPSDSCTLPARCILRSRRERARELHRSGPDHDQFSGAIRRIQPARSVQP
jgi:acyl-CoA synthetase (AMP-forming)/AMP-acid ligase II